MYIIGFFILLEDFWLKMLVKHIFLASVINEIENAFVPIKL